MVITSPQSSFGGGDSDGDCDELLASCHRNRISGLKRMRSFNSSSRPSLLGPSRQSPGLSGGRPPPIRSIASLEPDAAREGSFDCFSPPLYQHPQSASNSASLPPSLFVPSPACMASSSASSSSAQQQQQQQQLLPPTPAGRGRGFTRYMGGARRSSVPPMSLVAPNVYVGDETAAANLSTLVAAGVTRVLNCTNLPSVLEHTPGAPAFLKLGLLDNTSDLPHMQHAMARGTDFIADAVANGGTVLVHCHRGISRSATLAIAYLVKTTQQPAEVVFEQMRACRRIVDPNLSYWMALKEWERRSLPPSALRRASSATPTRSMSFGTGGGASTPTPVRPLSRAG